MAPPQPFRLQLGGRSSVLHDRRIYVVGQAADADVRIVHASVAERHARLVVDGDTITVDDLGSAGGVFVAGQRVEHAALHAGDTVRFGEVAARLERPAAPPAMVAAARFGHEETFPEVMARELARAPWFALSLMVHAAAFALLSWIAGAPAPTAARVAQVEVLSPEPQSDVAAEPQVQETVTVEKVEEVQDMAEPVLEPALREPQSEPAFDLDAFAPGFEGVGLTSLRGSGRGRGGFGGDDIFSLGSDALRRGSLPGTVSRLRQTGLEIMFVFDSTGSMDDVLDGAKRRIYRMVEVLHALVPGARIGIVTYRDHGRGEDYVTRSVPVTHDVYRVINFMHTITAHGGGDFPEAVLDALEVATKQRWLPESRRVVVLIGDAPPHKEDEGKVRQSVQSFARDHAFVHTIATTDGAGRSANPDTERTFAAIAREGKGAYSLLSGQDQVLQQVLVLAFGAEHRKDLDEVAALVEKRTRRTDVAALDLVQRADLAGIEKALRRKPVDDELIKAVIELKNPRVTRFLIDKMADPALPPGSRQACAFAVMRILELPRPPLDPESDDLLPKAERARLLRKLDR